jgi:EAL domain-containing protein (putative c-di-GMP-specific phosphodiesterase class I)/ActR/RegA family two-component response regulator
MFNTAHVMVEALRLVVIDDDTGVGEFVTNAVRSFGVASRFTTDPGEFRALIEAEEPEFAILDLQMPEVDGIELLRYLGTRGTRPKVLLMSGADQRVLTAAARLAKEYKLDVVAALRKPFSLAELKTVLTPHLAVSAVPDVADLRRALQAREFEVYYQPIVSLSGNGGRSPIRVTEALVRWRHPERGLLPPDLFIPVIERHGLATELTEQVLAQVLTQTREWDAAGRIMSTSINLAPSSLKDIDLPDRLWKMVRGSGVDPLRITFEVTETTAMDNTTLSLDVLGRIRLKGFGLSIDDFGTGFSSLIELYRMPFSALKIDKSFVLETDSSEEARVIVRSIADLAHNLGLTVCAEGVERPAHLAVVMDAGCEVAQGYFFSKPVPASHLPDAVGPIGEEMPRPTRAAGGS